MKSLILTLCVVAAITGSFWVGRTLEKSTSSPRIFVTEISLVAEAKDLAWEDFEKISREARARFASADSDGIQRKDITLSPGADDAIRIRIH